MKLYCGSTCRSNASKRRKREDMERERRRQRAMESGSDSEPAGEDRVSPGISLADLLAPFADPDLTQAGRLLHVPPHVAATALGRLPADLCSARLGAAPPMSWLVALATDVDGLLTGAVVFGREYVRFDGVQVGRAAARELAARIGAAFPAADDQPGALESAVAEAWSSWTAREPVWTGVGTDLLAGPLPADAEVAGLWFD
ncbi:hypothetical protein [Geodermatophilus sabuli]|nr:hypothetical protein [Geodermatophilus sabuli]MBB3084216.1 hypothetical protein [Geodermatophilus sabuli]